MQFVLWLWRLKFKDCGKPLDYSNRLVGADCRQGRLAVQFNVPHVCLRNVVTICRGGKYSSGLTSVALEAGKVYGIWGRRARPQLYSISCGLFKGTALTITYRF
jgi:hypothetical protein